MRMMFIITIASSKSTEKCWKTKVALKLLRPLAAPKRHHLHKKQHPKAPENQRKGAVHQTHPKATVMTKNVLTCQKGRKSQML